MIPDLSAFGNVVLFRKEDALIVPAEAIRTAGGEPVVYVGSGAQFSRRKVQLGAHNNTQVEILAGVAAGEEVALQTPTVTPKSEPAT